MLLVDGIEYLVEKEIAARYGLTVHWLRKDRYSCKTIPYYKMHGKIFYTIKDVDKSLKDNLKKM